MKNKIIGYILITPFIIFLIFIFIILPFMALTQIFFQWFPKEDFYTGMGCIILSIEALGLMLWFTSLGFKLIDKDKKKK